MLLPNGKCIGKPPVSTIGRLFLAVDFHGYPVYANWDGRSLLVLGESGSGKSTLLSDLLWEAEPFVQDGLAEFYGIDLKKLELTLSRGLFMDIATDIDAAVSMLERLHRRMLERADLMAGDLRDHTPTPESPRIVLVVDELAELFRQDSKTNKAVKDLLTSILGMGRAAGFVVWGFSQRTLKEAVPVRDDFNGQRFALRMSEADARLFLPSIALEHGLMPWTFPAGKPGVCCTWDADRQKALIFRAEHIADDDLRTLSCEGGGAAA